MDVSHLRSLGAYYLHKMGCQPAATAATRKKAPSHPSMASERWGTLVAVEQASVGDRFSLGRLLLQADDGQPRSFALERGHTAISFHWLDERGAWQRRAALVAELKPGMRAEVWGEGGVAEAVLVEGGPRP
ncbi:MAG: hypothetical protein VKP62_01985 [Candidatus Sericytochromatia bacterium]|nr:hypothetical protein [Candidatus Sericytochromatia bacterium]